MGLSESEIASYNDFAGIFGYKPTQALKWLEQSPCKTTFLLAGNRFGKGETMVMDWIKRVWGVHPQGWKNINPGDQLRTLRIACSVLPTEKGDDGGEVKNTIYPILRRRLPRSWVVKDITVRDPILRVRSPFVKSDRAVNLEFVSYGQENIRQAGVPRRAIMQDEESGQDFFEEQQARTMDTGGDMLIGFTPIPGQIGWMFDTLYERASVIYRTPLVRKRFRERYAEDYPEVQKIEGKDDICVIMAATDDNPYFTDLAAEIGKREGRELSRKQYLDEFFRDRYGEDEDLIDARRYGIFKQLSGKVLKPFSYVHCIDGYHYFPMGIPRDWFHVRTVDYHPKIPWAAVWFARSPANEIFVYRDAAFVPGKMQTYDIVSNMVDMSGDYVFKRNFIDPLADQTQVNTGFSTLSDLNRLFAEFKRDGRGQGGFWIPFDTKGTIGREEFMKRLLNAKRVGVPFNNTVVENGRSVQLPTIWFFNECRRSIEAINKWRYEDWETRSTEMRNDEKEKVQNKWSHFPLAIECALKDPFVSKPTTWSEQPISHENKSYFKGGR